MRTDDASRDPIPLDDQARAWSAWNAASRENRQLNVASSRQGALVEDWVRALGRKDLRILDAGCGVGWMSQRLAQFGHVTGVDFAADVVERAKVRVPGAEFLAGDLMSVPLVGKFDVIVMLEVLSHVADQPSLIERLASLLTPGGHLMIATQNRPVLERCSFVGPRIPGTIRQWVSAKELRALLEPRFSLETLTSVEPLGDRGLLRVLNSPKLCRVVDAVFGRDRYREFKERRLLGYSLVARARVR